MKNITKYVLALAAAAVLAAPSAAAGTKAPAAVKETSTLENLQLAFNTASNARARFEAYAVKAEAEGYLGVAGLFKAAALSEGVQAGKFGKAIEGLGGTPKADLKKVSAKATKANLKEALTGKYQESRNKYGAFLKKAEADKAQPAMYAFKGAMAAARAEGELFSQAQGALNDWKARKKFIVCQTCGYLTADLGLRVCPVCSRPRTQFSDVE